MRVSIAFPAYNEKRYSKPWIARIESWAVGGLPVYRFGNFIGRHGDAGEVEVEAEPGDLIAAGQKDYRGHNTERDFFIVQDDGSLEEVTLSEARRAMLEKTEPEHV